MSTDLTLNVRRAVVAHLHSYAPLTALVSAARIYGEQPPANPQWPFITYSSTTLPYEAVCGSGSQITVSVHVFCNGPYTDAVLQASAQVVEAMRTLDTYECEWIGNIGPLRDSPPDEQAKYHVVVQFRVTEVV